MLRLDAGYYILDARCVMLNAKVHGGSQNSLVPGSARVSRVGFGVSPKQSLLKTEIVETIKAPQKVRDGEDAIASRRDARATRRPAFPRTCCGSRNGIGT